MKYVKPIALCIIIGFLMGFFLYSGYEKKGVIIPTIGEGEKLKFARLGSYNSEELMEKALSNIDSYIYRVENNKYIVYIGITLSNTNFSKIEEYYKKIGYVIDKEEFYVSNKEFLKVLNTYDEMLTKTEEDSVIHTIITGVLTKYEELVMDG